MTKIAYILFALLLSISGNSQNPAASAKYSLPYESARDIIMSGIKDKNGNLWFATSTRGVYRYDGESFVHFTDRDGLIGNAVSWIYEDKSGKLWFSTNNGVYTYDGKIFTNFPIPLPPVSFVGPDKYGILARMPIEVGKILQDKAGNFWFLTQDHGVYRYNSSLGDSIPIGPSAFSNFLPDETPQCIVETKNGDIFIGSWRGGGIYRYDKGRFIQVGGFHDGMIFCMLEDKAGNLWVGTRNAGADRYSLINGQATVFTNFSAKDGINTGVTCIFEDSKGNIWLSTDALKKNTERGDVFRYDRMSFTNVTAKEPLTTKYDLVYDARTILEDNDGYIWIGSRAGRLFRYDPRASSFTDFSEKVSN